jgi:predicted unusual protein kinase regulating ubiquinone biosynthesis (AarF/ABC1/UbiB family)
MSDDAKLPPKGRFTRFRKLATLSAQLGAEVLTKGVKRLAGQDPELLSTGAAEKLVATLGDLKGAAMKFGQAISMDSELITPEVQAVLARLQNQAPPMAYSQVVKVIQEGLGAPPEQLYATFDPDPMAAASLGQVHRATLKDGREVAVKVQYPGIAEGLAADLDNLGALVKTIGRTSRLLDGRAYYQELHDELMLELDYRREAALATAFAHATARLPDLKVPEVIDDHTSEKVLTLEMLHGATLKDWLATHPSPEDRFRVSRLLIRAVYGPFLIAGEIHADPHPGNFMVMPDGRLGVLDFGSVKRFSPNFVQVNRGLFQQAVRGEHLDVLALSRAVGVSIETSDAEAEPLIREVLHLAGQPLRSQEYDYAQSTFTRDMKKFFRHHATTFLKIRPPAEAVMFFRAAGGLSQNLKLLGAKGDFRKVYAELAEEALKS